MPVARAIQAAFTRIYGKPCWNVKPGIGSFLTFEFGKPHLVVREPMIGGSSAKVRESLARRNVVVHGEWHLWIYCCEWEVTSGGKKVGDSSTKARIRRAANSLNGQKLTEFSLSTRTLRSVFEFDLGSTLTTKPYDKVSEQWLLYEPANKVLIVRADGHYRHARSRAPESHHDWKPVAG